MVTYKSSQQANEQRRVPCKLNNEKKLLKAPEEDEKSSWSKQEIVCEERLLTNFFEAMESFNKMI